MSENRKSTRHQLSLPVTVTVAGRTIEARTSNLSLGGVGVVLEERIAMGTKVAVSFRIPSYQAAIESEGEVRWSTGSETGIQFSGLRARDVWELNQYFDGLSG